MRKCELGGHPHRVTELSLLCKSGLGFQAGNYETFGLAFIQGKLL